MGDSGGRVVVSESDRRWIAEEWRRFSGQDVLKSHWERANWWPGREAYYWFLRFHEDTGVLSLAAECQRDLVSPALDHVPPGNLHMTMSRVGFTDEVSLGEVRARVEEARQRISGLAPFGVQVGPLAGSDGAVRLGVVPQKPLTALRSTFFDSPAVAAAESFVPHITVAYVNRSVPAEEIVAQVRDIRGRVSPETTVIASAHLVLLRREQRSYAIATLEQVPLKG